MKSDEFTIDSLEKLLVSYEYALKMLETEISILIKEFQNKNNYNPIDHVKSRLKTSESIIKKIEKKGYDLNIQNIKEHVHDIVGIRIVCSFRTDVYNIVNMIKKSEHLIIKEEKDYIKNPKETGYTSYHIIVNVPVSLSTGIEYIEAEIQIRTMAMDFWASLDHKIQYKFPTDIPEDVKEEMYNCSVDIRKLDLKMGLLNEIVNKYNN